MTETLKKFSDESILAKQTFTEQVSEDNSVLSADEIPVWLNEAYIEIILRKHETNSKVKSLQIQQCGGKGDSYVSTMYRVGVSYYDEEHQEVEKSRSLVIKTLGSDVANDTFGAGSYNVQEKEMEMYQRVLPELKRTLESIGEDGSFYPSILTVDEEFDVIVMEDLMEKKYTMADRLVGQDVNHAKMTLSKIARMHAASIAVKIKNPTAFDKFDMGIFSRKSESLHTFFKSMCIVLAEEVLTWEGYEYFGEKLMKVVNNVIENGLRVFDCDEGDLQVLAHGDLWTNNMLFCYNEDGTPKRSVLIDFQLSVVASPAVDLLYFLFTSTTDDVRENNIEELLQHYYYELKDVLIKLSVDLKAFPTLQAFQMQMAKKYFYAMTSCLLVFPVMIGQDKDANMAILLGTDEKAVAFKRKLVKDSRFQKNTKMMLPRLDAKGLLDEL